MNKNVGAHLLDEKFNYVRVVEHGSTVQGCHFLNVARCQTLFLLVGLHLKHQTHYFNCTLSASKMDRSAQIVLLR